MDKRTLTIKTNKIDIIRYWFNPCVIIYLSWFSILLLALLHVFAQKEIHQENHSKIGSTNKKSDTTGEKGSYEKRVSKEMYISSNRIISDFFIEVIDSHIPCVIWSEYDKVNDDVVIISASLFEDGKWSEPQIIHEGERIDPAIRTASGFKKSIHVLMACRQGSKNDLQLITFDGTDWQSAKKIADPKTRTFGYGIAASKLKQEIYVVFGDYRERHFFPYILTFPLSGHMSQGFGKLFLVKGDGVKWRKEIIVTKKGRFSCKDPYISLNDKDDILHIVWNDGRHGHNKMAIYYDHFLQNRFVGNEKISDQADLLFSPIISCNQKNDIFIAWSVSDEDGGSRFCCMEWKNGKWRDVMKSSKQGFLHDMVVDLLGNVHFLWEDRGTIYYQRKKIDAWDNTLPLEGFSGKFKVDVENNIHLVLLRRDENRRDSLIYQKLEQNG